MGVKPAGAGTLLVDDDVSCIVFVTVSVTMKVEVEVTTEVSRLNELQIQVVD